MSKVLYFDVEFEESPSEVDVEFEESSSELDVSFEETTDDMDVEFEEMNQVEIDPSDHTKLLGRDAPDQHPMSAITGLAEALSDAKDKHYVHVQRAPAKVWSVSHYLGKYPAVSVVDSANSIVVGEITHADINHLSIEFTGDFSGRCYCN